MKINKKFLKYKLFIFISSFLGFLFFILYTLPTLAIIIVYNSVFNFRGSTSPNYEFEVNKFENLKRKKYEIKSNKNQLLVGYNYYKENLTPKGIIVLTHGLGSGHNYLMDIANYFVNNSYYSFAFDCTGNDESEGKNIIGPTQELIDLNNVLSYLKSSEDFKNLPILLFGHSVGAYASCAVLKYHNDVKGVASLCGFNQTSELIHDVLETNIGKISSYFMPFVKNHEKHLFKTYASISSIDGLENSTCDIYICQNGLDKVVPPKIGFDIYYEKYKDNPRFIFKYNPLNSEHQSICDSRKWQNYHQQFFIERSNYFSNHTYTLEEDELFYKNNFDYDFYYDKLNKEFVSNIVEFYNNCLA